MRKVVAVVAALFLLTGCTGTDGELARAMELRERFLNGSGCSFLAKITADYGDKVYTFSMDCQADQDGTLFFTVSEPESICGISGEVSSNGGKLTFEDTALAFETLADGQISPVSAPWILISTLRGGYLTSCTQEGEYFRLSIDDSYEEDALHLDIWLNAENNPVSAEILWDGRRIVSLAVEDFTFV